MDTVTIEKIVNTGLGLGRLTDGLVVMLPGVLPGEKVRFQPVRRKKNHLEARLVEVVVPAPERRAPRCHHYGACGGCDFQHIAYETQLALKQEILTELLLRSGLAGTGTPRFIEPPLASPDRFGYRQRIRLQVDAAGRIGYFRSHSRAVEPISSCLLAREEINQVLVLLRATRTLKTLLGQTRSVECILSPDPGEVFLLFHLRRKPRPNDRQLARALQQEAEQVKCVFLAADGHGAWSTSGEPDQGLADRETVRFTLPAAATGGKSLSLCLEVGGFCQVNQRQNENFVRTLLDWAAIKRGDRVLDLFCGMGNFSLPAALFARQVVGFDLQRSAIRSAGRNAALADLDNCRFERQGAAEGARLLADRGDRFELIFLDPPRAGCDAAIQYLPDLGAGRILYLSCDPATLVRDLKKLAERGYRVDRLRLVDMFPQTHHLETITALSR